MFDVRLRAYEPDGPELGFLPEPLQMNASVVNNDAGALTLTYSRLAAGGDILRRGLEEGLEVAVEVSNGGEWVEPDGARFLRIGRGNNQLDEADVVNVRLPSYGWLARKARNLDTTNLLPEDHSEAGKRPFYSESAGVILGTLLDENAARGGITLARGWSSAADSNGDAWAKVATLFYDLGLGLDVILGNLAAQGMCDWRTAARELRLYNADSPAIARDLAGVVRLWLGTDVVDAPSDESLEDVVSTMLIRGDGGLILTEDNPAAPTPWGKWEGYLSQGGVTDEGTARTLVQADLERAARVRGQYTRQLLLAGDVTHAPLIDYAPGDWITAPTTGHGERVRVQQVTLTKGPDGVGGSLVLNDRVLDAQLRQSRRITGITGGATNQGSGVRPAPDGPDRRQPAAPTGLVVDSDAYLDPDGAARGVLSMTWAPVTTATDGTLLEVAGYDVAIRDNVAGAPWAGSASSDDTEVTYSPVDVGAALQVKVRARGKYSTTPGAWSAPVTLTVTDDATPPPKPSAPQLTTRLATVIVAWDGATDAGGAMPRDFHHLDILRNGQVIGSILAASGVSTFYDVGRDATPTAYRFQAVDRSGNVSDLSDPATITPTLVGGPDLEANSVTTNALQAGAVQAYHLGVGALNFQTAFGMTLDAAIVTGSLVRTAASGARTEMTTEGIQVYDYNNDLVVDLGSNVDTGLAIRNPYTGEMVALARTMFPNENRTFYYEDDWNGWSGSGAFSVRSGRDRHTNYEPTDRILNSGALWTAGPAYRVWAVNSSPIATIPTGEAITPVENNPRVSGDISYTETGSGVRAADGYISADLGDENGGSFSSVADAMISDRQHLRARVRFVPRSGGSTVTTSWFNVPLTPGDISAQRRTAGSVGSFATTLQAGTTYDIEWQIQPNVARYGSGNDWYGIQGASGLWWDNSWWSDDTVGELVPNWGEFEAICTTGSGSQYVGPQQGDDESARLTYHGSIPSRNSVLIHSLGCTFYYSA